MAACQRDACRLAGLLLGSREGRGLKISGEWRTGHLRQNVRFGPGDRRNLNQYFGALGTQCVRKARER